jgi:hypothetical protein
MSTAIRLNPLAYLQPEPGPAVRRSTMWRDVQTGEDLSGTTWRSGWVNFAGERPDVGVDLPIAPAEYALARRLAPGPWVTYLLHAPKFENIDDIPLAKGMLPNLSVGRPSRPVAYAQRVRWDAPLRLVASPAKPENPRGWYAAYGFAFARDVIGSIRLHTGRQPIIPVYAEIRVMATAQPPAGQGWTRIPFRWRPLRSRRTRTNPGGPRMSRSRHARPSLKAPRVGKIRLPYAAAQGLMTQLTRQLRNVGIGPGEIVVAGSLRRKKAMVGDLDILLVNASDGEWVALDGMSGLTLDAYGTLKASGWFRSHRKKIRVDFRRVARESLGAALEYFTGPAGHNLGMRMKAKKLGMRLNEYGLFDKHGAKVAGATEESIYDVLRHPWKPPEMRGR